MKMGRIIGATMVLIVFFTLLVIGAHYTIFAKDKSNSWIIAIFFLIPSLLAFGWFYIVAKEGSKKRIHEILDRAKDFKGEVYVNGREIKLKQASLDEQKKPAGV